jgi:hypothetical protein
VRALRRVGFDTSAFLRPRQAKERSEHRRSLPFDSAERSRSGIIVQFRVIDPKAAIHEVNNYEERIYGDVQLAARRSLALMTLDVILTNRNQLSEDILRDVKEVAKRYGAHQGRGADDRSRPRPSSMRCASAPRRPRPTSGTRRCCGCVSSRRSASWRGRPTRGCTSTSIVGSSTTDVGRTPQPIVCDTLF